MLAVGVWPKAAGADDMAIERQLSSSDLTLLRVKMKAFLMCM